MTAGGGWSLPNVPGPVEWLPVLDIPEPVRQRRLTVLLRLVLLIPHFVVLFVLSFVAFFAAVAGWFAALVTGRLPEPIADFLAGYVGYHTRVTASAMLLVDRYPPFSLRAPTGYPVQIELRPGPLNRLAVLFRIFLMIPAVVIQSLAAGGWVAAGLVIWLVVLIMGRMPRPLFEASAATARYTMRLNAYILMLTSAYPKDLFGDGEPLPAADGTTSYSATQPLRLSGAGTALLILFLALGLAGNLTETLTNNDSSTSTAPAVAPNYRVQKHPDEAPGVRSGLFPGTVSGGPRVPRGRQSVLREDDSMHQPATQGAPHLVRRAVLCVLALLAVVGLQLAFDASAHAHSGATGPAATAVTGR